MTIFSALRFCTGLAWDAGEALADWLNCDRAVDSLWAQQHTDAAARLADVEAEQEVAEPAPSFWHGERSLISPTAGVAPNLAAGEAPRRPSDPPSGAGHPTSERDCSPPEGPARAGQPNRECRGYSHIAEVPGGPELRAHSSPGHPNLQWEHYDDAAIACRKWAEHESRAAASRRYWNWLADQLQMASNAMKLGEL